MCERTGTPPALVCTVGDLKQGQWFHDPNGETWLVVSDQLINRTDDTRVVNIGNGPTNRFGNALKGDELKGLFTLVRSATRLGYDEQGRLYASTFLNGWYCDPDDEEVDLAEDADEAKNQADAAYYQNEQVDPRDDV